MEQVLTIAGILVVIAISTIWAYLSIPEASEKKRPDKETMVIIGILLFVIAVVVVGAVVF